MPNPTQMPQKLPENVVVFIDYENVRKLARQQFCALSAEPHEGMVDPVKIAQRIVQKRARVSQLQQVFVYRGRPVPQHQPKAAMFFDKYARDWEAEPRCSLVQRPLKYSFPNPHDREFRVAQEKGIDVSLAIDVAKISLEAEGVHAIVVFSTDSDLLPAIEFARSRGTHVEVACWEGLNPLKFKAELNAKLWCHFLNEGDFNDACIDGKYT